MGLRSAFPDSTQDEFDGFFTKVWTGGSGVWASLFTYSHIAYTFGYDCMHKVGTWEI